MATVALTVVWGVFVAASARAENWPQWRGPHNNGISAETGLPTTWSKTEGVVWRLELPGSAGSTPAIWNDRVFLTSATEDGTLVLIAADTSGKELWRKSLGGGNETVRGDEGNYASPSPSTDGKHVWAMVGTGVLACYDFAGQEVWHVDLQQRYGKFNIQFGMASTPVLDGNRLYVQLLHTGGQIVAALDAASGDELWRIDRKTDARAECEHSYASPILYRDRQREYLLTHGADYIVAHRLDNGQELWRCGGLNPLGKYNPTLRFVASPVAADGLVVVPTAKNGPVLGLDPSAQGDVTDSTEAHRWVRAENTPDVPSPLVHGGLVYLCRENGVLICMDAQTGKEQYEQRAHSDRYRASPVFADGKIYLTSRDGTVSVVRAGRKFELLATNKMEEDLSASPAISGGRIYLRTFAALYAIGAR
ncbi:MAG: PQQ-binding-like beta-propeller repeat protein [Pirellulales bacterium]|nr:PQQ-binding-like beta-propeller repeat protein [Pirellulales bacterium]